MRVSDTSKNRGAHGERSFKLDGMPSSSENPPGFSRGECQEIEAVIDKRLIEIAEDQRREA